MKKSQHVSVVDNALDTLDVKQLRALVRELAPKLNEKTTTWLNKKLIARAIKNDPDWVPRPSEQRVTEIEDIFATAKTNKKGEPKGVDIYRQEAIYAYEAKDYRAASRIFAVLPVPLTPSEDGECDYLGNRYLELDLELHELHLVSSYLGAEPEDRPQAVFSVLSSTLEFGFELMPLSNFEAEDTPGFDEFLVAWRAFLTKRLAATEGAKSQDLPPEHYWFREVVGIMDGPEGLAEIAWRTQNRHDLEQWCLAVAESEGWEATADAYRESATLLSDPKEIAHFLQRAAWIEKKYDDSPPEPPSKIAEQAWRAQPTFERLVTWLRCAQTRNELIIIIESVVPELQPSSELDGAFLMTLCVDFAHVGTILVTASQSRGSRPVKWCTKLL